MSEDHRSFISKFPYLILKSQRILFYSHPPLSQLIQIVVSRAFYSKCIERVHTSRLVALGGEGREEVTCGAWHTFQHHSLFLSGHGLSPRYLWWFSRPDGACQRNLLSRREKVTDVSRPKGRLAAPPPIHPRTLIIAFSAASIEVFLRLQCLWDLEKRQGRPHEGTRAMARRTAQLSTS